MRIIFESDNERYPFTIDLWNSYANGQLSRNIISMHSRSNNKLLIVASKL